jgi:serine/threonine protein kinase
MHLSDEALRRMLRVEETDLLVAESTELQHLEQCAICQKRLAELSGELPWFAGLSDEILQVHGQTDQAAWDGIAEQPTGEWDGNGTDGLGAEPIWSSGHITVNIQSRDGHDTDPESWESDARVISTDFLPPALHPELLGRLGRYDIEQLIGAGGFGIVFKAYDTELRRVVALKVLAPHLMTSGAARKRFAREAQSAAAIMHEHVIPIYDVVSQPDACYLVMQYVAGSSLQERVDRRGPLTITEVLRIGAQIAAGLQAAHQQGLVHRDVKPANILLEESVERVMISDFGLARTADDANLTRSGAITGTPHYMSPEQASGALVDARSDLFSLGSVLYFACTGRPAFRAPQIVAVLNRICNFPHRRVSEVNQDIPGPLADLIDRLLEKNPEQRFGSAWEVEQELRALLASWQSGKMVASVAAPPSVAMPENLSVVVKPAENQTWGYRTSRWLASAVAVAGLSAVAIWYGVNGSKSELFDSTKTNPLSEDGITAHGAASATTTAEATNEPTNGTIKLTTPGVSNTLRVLKGDAEKPFGYLLQIQWNSDSEPLELEMDAISQQWQSQDEELDLWLEFLKEKRAQQAVK